MPKRRVPLHQNPQRFVEIDEGATNGATLGKNLYGEDGKLLTPAQLINTDTPAPSNVRVAWRFIQEIPENIQKLAALVGKGLAARDAEGEWTLRTLQQGTGIVVANGDGEDGNPSVALNAASIASLELADSSVQEVRQGTGVTVDNSDPRRPIVSATGGGAGGGVLPVVTGEITAGQPVFLIADDGKLIYTEIT